MTINSSKQNILIYRIGSLGDSIVALPCLHLISRAFPGSRRILLTNIPVHVKAPAAAAVLEGSGLIDEYLTYTIGTRSIFQLAALTWRIRRLKIKTLIYLAPPRGEAVVQRDIRFFRLGGIKEIIGLPVGDLAANRFEPDKNLYEREASRLGRCIAPLGDIRVDDGASWDLHLTQAERTRASAEIAPIGNKPFLVLAIASKRMVSDWGIDNWKALSSVLHREFPNHVAVCLGAKEDRAASQQVLMEWPGATLNLCGDLTPRQSAAVIQKASLFIGPDSGPMHLAASVGTPCVAIFPANKRPGIWFPAGSSNEVIYHETDCSGCDLQVCIVRKKKCLLSITVQEVLSAVLRLRDRQRQWAIANQDI